MPRLALPSRAALVLAMLALGGTGWAAGPLGGQGSPITTSAYSIDLFAGPVLSSARVTGLGGAYAGIAEGVDGDLVNAAAPALRVPFSYDWFDYDVSAGLTLPGLLSGTDFDNNGTAGFEYQDFYFLSGGLNLQVGGTGLGISADSRVYSLGQVVDDPDAPGYVRASLTSLHLLLSRSFWHGQLLIGLGFRLAFFSLDASPNGDVTSPSTNLFLASGNSWESGILLAPHGQRFRIGLSGRLPVESSPEGAPDGQGDYLIRGFYLPAKVVLPWELEAGVAFEFGSRPLNPEWVNPRDRARPLVNELKLRREERRRRGVGRDEDRQAREADQRALEEFHDDLRARRERAWRELPRSRLLLSASVLITGPVADAVGTESFFQKTVDRSGEQVSITPRLGLEAEPLPGWLQLRLGTYYEPSRYRHTSARLHGTAGVDVKVLPWTVFGLYPDDTWWSLGAVGDFTRGYLSVAFRVGVWR